MDYRYLFQPFISAAMGYGQWTMDYPYLCSMKCVLAGILGLVAVQCSQAQTYNKSGIQADYIVHNRSAGFENYIKDTVINEAFDEALDEDGEYGYETACLSASQFLIQNRQVEKGINNMLAHYKTLQTSTKQALFEAIFGLYPQAYTAQVKQLIAAEKNPKFFSIQAAYLLQNNGSPQNKAYLLQLLQARFPAWPGNNLLQQLHGYISNHAAYAHGKTPPVAALFANQQALQQKIIYSFQRWDRDYSGLAIVQNTDGSFVRDSTGKLVTVQQLARSAANLPYFITDGNTPQGIYSITGIQVSGNHFLGPTPTIQMVMPFEDSDAFWGDSFNSAYDTFGNYQALLPAAWQNYAPMAEAFWAGKIGRSQIICHGTTLNPAYFSGRPYYPVSPTLGCLCAGEQWDAATGKLLESEQLKLVNAFTTTPGRTGLLMVVNLNDKQAPVSIEEVEALVKEFEKQK